MIGHVAAHPYTDDRSTLCGAAATHSCGPIVTERVDPPVILAELLTATPPDRVMPLSCDACLDIIRAGRAALP
jgi:hypothetical protein